MTRELRFLGISNVHFQNSLSYFQNKLLFGSTHILLFLSCYLNDIK